MQASEHHDGNPSFTPRVMYSPREWAAAVGVSHPTVYRWIRAGLPVIRVGAVTRILPEEATAWMRTQGGAK